MLPAFLLGPAAKYIGTPVAIALLTWGGYLFIHSRGVADCERDNNLALAEHVRLAASQAREIALQDAEVSGGYEITRFRIQTVYRDKAVEVVREITPDCMQCGLGPDGLRLINSIRRGELPAVSSQPDGGLPPAADAPIGPSPGARQINTPGQPNVLRLRDAAQSIGGKDQGAGI
jgi:hypothetical protein